MPLTLTKDFAAWYNSYFFTIQCDVCSREFSGITGDPSGRDIVIIYGMDYCGYGNYNSRTIYFCKTHKDAEVLAAIEKLI